MAALVFLATAAGALLVAAYLVVRVLDYVAFLVAQRAGACGGMFRVPVGSNHLSPFTGPPLSKAGIWVMLNINGPKVKDSAIVTAKKPLQLGI